MVEIRYVADKDKEFWYRLDKHLPESEFEKKVRDRQGYVIFEDGEAVGLLRYNRLQGLRRIYRGYPGLRTADGNDHDERSEEITDKQQKRKYFRETGSLISMCSYEQ